MKKITEIDPITELEKYIGKESASEAARRMGVAVSYVTGVLGGTRVPGKKILACLGLKKVIVYKRITQDNGT